jgi:hypothetical protein
LCPLWLLRTRLLGRPAGMGYHALTPTPTARGRFSCSRPPGRGAGMKRLRLVILVVLACGLTGRPSSRPRRGQPAPRHRPVGAAAELRGLKRSRSALFHQLHGARHP